MEDPDWDADRGLIMLMREMKGDANDPQSIGLPSENSTEQVLERFGRYTAECGGSI